MKTIGQLLKHDFEKGSLYLYDSNRNRIYFEDSEGYWNKSEYNSNGNEIYHESSTGYWSKYECDANGNQIYYENSEGYWNKSEFDTDGNKIYYEDSDGVIEGNRPKPSCEGKVVVMHGKKYKLTEL
jgi:hypothetical protein